MVKVELVPVVLVDNIFPAVSDGFNRASKKSSSDIDASYLYRECRAGNAMLVVASDETNVTGALVLRNENWCGKSVMHTLGLWCSARGAYRALEAKKIELARMTGATSLVASARASERGHCGFLRLHPNAKILRYVIEVELK